MSQPITVVDAFTDVPFAGNPAAVCVLERPAEAAWMQRVAREMNLSETAFLTRRGDGGYDLRWFTPTVEVDLCGHATLASAHVLWETERLAASDVARFFTRSGALTAERKGDLIELDFPSNPPAPTDAPEGLGDALGVTPLFVGKSRFDYLIEVSSEAIVRAVRPDLARIRALPVRGVIVTSRAESAEHDFVSRFFAPAAGVDEDPVTGSAHTTLSPFWSERLGRADLVGFQASARGGVVRVGLRGDRVKLGGHAVTMLRGELAAVAL